MKRKLRIVPPLSFGRGMSREIAASHHLEVIACNDWTSALIGADDARRRKDRSEADRLVSHAAGVRDCVISKWVRRPENVR